MTSKDKVKLQESPNNAAEIYPENSISKGT